MLHRIKVLTRAVRRMFARELRAAEPHGQPAPFSAEQALSLFAAAQRGLLVTVGIAIAGWLLYVACHAGL